MKVLITGTHFTPAQAVIEELLKNPETEIVYLGRKYARDGEKVKSMESEVLPKLDVKFIPIVTGKLNRFLSIQTILSFLKTPIGFIQAFYYLLKESPDLIVSFGGFTGMPVVVCGWFLSTPSIIHEQSLKMGLSNLISSIFADRVGLSFENTKVPSLINPKKIVVTGNPVRKDFFELEKQPSKEIKNFVASAKKPLVLITAGNQGSHFINLQVEDKWEELTNIAAVVHQTGDSKYDDFANLKKHESPNYLIKKWVSEDDMAYLMGKSDLVISRAGMNTLTELALKGTPSLMIPISVGNEQKTNAHFFAKNGLGEVLEEKKTTPEIFIGKIKEMLDKRTGLKRSAENAKKVVILNAPQKLVQEILTLKNSIDQYDLNFK